MSEYSAGTTVNLTLTFKTADDVLVDPTSVSGYVLRADGTKETFVYLTDSELTKSSVGVYVLAYPTLITYQAGAYRYGALGTGGVDISGSHGTFDLVDWPFD